VIRENLRYSKRCTCHAMEVCQVKMGQTMQLPSIANMARRRRHGVGVSFRISLKTYRHARRSGPLHGLHKRGTTIVRLWEGRLDESPRRLAKYSGE
jgi:hypothetical protein